MGSMVSKGVSLSYVVEEVNVSPGMLWSVVTDIENMPCFVSAIKEVKILGSAYKYNNNKNKNNNNKNKNENRKVGSDHSCETTSSRSKLIDSDVATKPLNKGCGFSNSCQQEEWNEVKEGFIWEETRCFLGRESKLRKCITSIGVSTSIADLSHPTSSSRLPGSSDIRRHQKYLRINNTVLGKTQTVCRLGSKTYTIIIDWDEVNPNHNSNVDDNTHIGSDSSTNTSTSSMNTSSFLPKKCQLTVTMAFIPNTIVARLKLLMAGPCGITRKMNRMFQCEVEEILREAERRENYHAETLAKEKIATRAIISQ
jgi:hypothetical protein